jgi:TRAP transporter TAXI family solute receptor
MIPLPQDVIDSIVSEHPYYEPMAIPASMYDTNTEIPTLFGANMVVIDCSLSEDVVYEITRALFENVDAIRNSHPAAKDVTAETSARTPIPLHPGAERYFREAGFLD